jgi:hypothetical protein
LERRSAILSSLALAAGLWLLGSPLVLGYSSDAATANYVACGAAIVLLALVRLAVAPAAAFLSGVIAVIGAWVFAAAFWLAEASVAAWNEAIVGGLVVILATASVLASRPASGAGADRPW